MSRKEDKKYKKKFTRDDLELTLLALPTTLWFLVFSYLPMFGVIIAFKNFKPIKGLNFLETLFGKSEWVGFKNFEFLFASGGDFFSSQTWWMLRNTILYNIVMIALGVIVPVTLAIMISELYSQKLAKVCQTMMFLPNFISWVVVSYFVFAFLSESKGLVNSTLRSMGRETVQWYQAEAMNFWPPFLILLNVWKGCGYGMVVYLATIAGIDQTLYEAAIIDGATKWQQVKHITLPMLKTIMTIMLIMAVGRIFSSDFGLFYNVPKVQGPLYRVTLTIDVYVYNALTSLGDIGMSSAGALFQSVCGLIMITLANAVVRKIDPNSALF
jgi:putative aldouronate transport system permease protein